MSDEFITRDSHIEAVEKLRNEVGPGPGQKHKGGYLTQNEYATLIYYWAGEYHEAEEAEGVIASLANQSWAKTPQRELPVAGAVLALCELYRDLEPAWRSAYPRLFARVRHAIEKPKVLAAWNDYHIAQWLILRRFRREEGVEIIDKLLDRVAEGGTVRYDALEAMRIWAGQCKPFEIAWQRAAAERQERMLVKVQ